MRDGGFHPLQARPRHRNCGRGGLRLMVSHRRRPGPTRAGVSVQFECREPPEPSIDAKKANRWVVAGLDCFLSSYAERVVYGAREDTASVPDLF